MNDSIYILVPEIVNGSRISKKYLKSLTGNSIEVLRGRKKMPPEFVSRFFLPLRRIRSNFPGLVLAGPMGIDDFLLCKMTFPEALQLVIGPITPQDCAWVIEFSEIAEQYNSQARNLWDAISERNNHRIKDIENLCDIRDRHHKAHPSIMDAIRIIEDEFEKYQDKFECLFKNIIADAEPLIEKAIPLLSKVAPHDKIINGFSNPRGVMNNVFMPHIASIKSRHLRDSRT